jgi:hypothetical protein
VGLDTLDHLREGHKDISPLAPVSIKFTNRWIIPVWVSGLNLAEKGPHGLTVAIKNPKVMGIFGDHLGGRMVLKVGLDATRLGVGGRHILSDDNHIQPPVTGGVHSPPMDRV